MVSPPFQLVMVPDVPPTIIWQFSFFVLIRPFSLSKPLAARQENRWVGRWQWSVRIFKNVLNSKCQYFLKGGGQSLIENICQILRSFCESFPNICYPLSKSSYHFSQVTSPQSWRISLVGVILGLGLLVEVHAKFSVQPMLNLNILIKNTRKMIPKQ